VYNTYFCCSADKLAPSLHYISRLPMNCCYITHVSWWELDGRMSRLTVPLTVNCRYGLIPRSEQCRLFARWDLSPHFDPRLSTSCPLYSLLVCRTICPIAVWIVGGGGRFDIRKETNEYLPLLCYSYKCLSLKRTIPKDTQQSKL